MSCLQALGLSPGVQAGVLYLQDLLCVLECTLMFLLCSMECSLQVQGGTTMMDQEYNHMSLECSQMS